MGLIMHKGEAFGSNGGNSDIIPTNWETYRAMQLAGELDPDAYYFVDDVDVSSLLPTLINEPANNNVLVYDGTSGIWKNKMLTADDISYDENTSVEDNLTSLNSALTANIIGSPTTMSSTPYVFPSDGYIICSARGTDGFSAAEIKDANGVLFASPSISGTSMANTFQIVTYVKKGMSAIGAKSGASSANNVTFVPLKNN